MVAFAMGNDVRNIQKGERVHAIGGLRHKTRKANHIGCKVALCLKLENIGVGNKRSLFSNNTVG